MSDLQQCELPNVFLCLVLAKSQRRFLPIISESRQSHEALRVRGGFFDRGNGHPREAASSIPPAAANMAAKPQTPSLGSGLSILSVVVAHQGLRSCFDYRGWSFPSSLAGMLGLFAGAVFRGRGHPPGGRGSREAKRTRRA